MIRWLAELGISIAGTRALRVRGRKTGKSRAVVINLLTVDGVDYLVSPRGNTQWVRNVRAAGVVEMGPRWHADAPTSARWTMRPSPSCLRRYLDRWYWQVKDYVVGLTPDSTDEQLRARRPSIPVFALSLRAGDSAMSRRQRGFGRRPEVLADLLGGGLPRHRRGEIAPDAVENPDDLRGAAGAAMYTGPPESPCWLWTPCDMVNHPLLTLSTVPQVSPVTTPKWQTASPGWGAAARVDSSGRPPGRMLFAVTLLSSTIAS